MEGLEYNIGGETIKIDFPGDEPKKEKLDLNHIIPQLTKSKGGLYPHEILMLNQVSWYKTNSENSFSWFWENEWGINPQLLIDKLFNEGFIGVEDTRTTISRLTIPEIKVFLKEYGCNLTGKKAELIERLFAECDIPTIDGKLKQRRYCLTDKGKEEVEDKENEYVMYTFKNGNGISIFDMNILLYKNNPLDLSYKDIIWRKYVKQAEEKLQNSDFGGYSHTKWSMGRLLKDAGRYEESLYYFCESAVYDLAGLTFYSGTYDDNLSKLESMIQFSFPYNDKSLWTITPALVDELICIQKDIESIGLNYREQIIKNLKEIKIVQEVFSLEEKIEIFFAEIDEDYDKLEEIYSKLEKIMKDKYNKLMEKTIKNFLGEEKYEVDKDDNETKKINMFSNGLFLKRKIDEFDVNDYEDDEEGIKFLVESLLFTEEADEEEIERITELMKKYTFTEGDYEEGDYEEEDYEEEDYEEEDYEEGDYEEGDYEEEDYEEDYEEEYNSIENLCELFTSFDKERIIKYYKQNEIEILEDEELFWVAVHKTICKLYLYEGSTIKEKQFNESFDWLVRHGYVPLEDTDDNDEIE